MKIRIQDSDGVYRGGLFKTDRHTALNSRIWHGHPHPDYTEQLIDISGPNEPSGAGSWYLVQISKNPQIEGPGDGSDDFDSASRATLITLTEAFRWFDDKVSTPPHDLVELACVAGQIERTAGEPTDQAEYPPLTDAALEVWNLLERRVMTAKELADVVPGGPVSSDSIRKRVVKIRASGRLIKALRGRGYYRPDAPPPEGGHDGDESV